MLAPVLVLAEPHALPAVRVPRVPRPCASAHVPEQHDATRRDRRETHLETCALSLTSQPTLGLSPPPPPPKPAHTPVTNTLAAASTVATRAATVADAAAAATTTTPPRHTSPYLTSPRHTLPYRTLPYHTLPYRTLITTLSPPYSPHHTIPHLTLHYHPMDPHPEPALYSISAGLSPHGPPP